MPDNSFYETILELNTPGKISQYMYNNFNYSYQPYGVKEPLELFITKKGDCNDFSNFAAFVGNYHGYTVYQVRLLKENINHWIAVFKVNNHFIYLNNQYLNIDKYEYIYDIIDFYSIFYKDYLGYEIYDYKLNLIEP